MDADYRLAFATPANATRWQRRLVFSPLGRIVNFIVTMVAVSFLLGALIHVLGWHAKDADPALYALAEALERMVPAVVAYVALVRGVERRPVAELALRRLPTQGGLGLLVGIGLMSITVAALWLLGSYHVLHTNPGADWVPAVLVVGLGAGLGEEILFRGVLFRIVEEGLGTWWSLAISALFFGAVHLNNPGATAWSSAAIAIEAGILLGLLYHVTRSLWICAGMHLAWNVLQGTVFGIAVSGLPPDGFLVARMTGPAWLSGGDFGAEASVVALLVCTTLSAVLLVIAWRRGSIVPPAWRRRIPAAATTPG
ncbi:CPBP family intramembrane glutamic endopeptidase [Dyella sp. 2RAB6]|uniref:CPBP family intramembrane glutamic endopeptidase n=1 Tax=Dyella sp. 2RAB6 TaxID=3232992 RepID=UPI003F9307C6